MNYLQAVAASPNARQDDAIATIIEYFCIIAQHTYLVGCNITITPSDIDKNVRAARACYCELLVWAEQAEQRTRCGRQTHDQDDPFASAARPTEAQSQDNQITDDNVDFLQAAEDAINEYPDDDVSEREGEDLGTADSDGGDTAGPADSACPNQSTNPASRYRKWQSLAIIHAGSRFSEIQHEFGAIFNCNVLPGEVRYGIFRRDVDKASPANLMAHIMSRDMVRQSTRLGLAGAWQHIADLQEKIDELMCYCLKET
jgi:hypothetical protein